MGVPTTTIAAGGGGGGGGGGGDDVVDGTTIVIVTATITKLILWHGVTATPERRHKSMAPLS